MLIGATLALVAINGGSAASVVEITGAAQICVAAWIDGSLLRMPQGTGFDASADFASRLEQLHQIQFDRLRSKHGNARPRFISDGGWKARCRSRNPRIIIHYRPLDNGQPYSMSYTMTVGNRNIAGAVDQDLSRRPGLGGGILDAPWAPTSDIIHSEMTDHARLLLKRLRL